MNLSVMPLDTAGCAIQITVTTWSRKTYWSWASRKVKTSYGLSRWIRPLTRILNHSIQQGVVAMIEIDGFSMFAGFGLGVIVGFVLLMAIAARGD